MKRFMLLLAFILLPSACFADANDIAFMQRNDTNTSYITRLPATPIDGSNVITMFNGSTKRMEYGALGSGLSYASGVLSSIGGPKGDQGLQGIAGAQGPKGDQGIAGPQGNTGATGAAGSMGSQGLPGAQGAQGVKGDTGATGSIGAQGPKGDIGLTGATGATGSAGAAGTSGAQGPKGDVGATGSAGGQGPQGLQGAQGIQGVQGVPGTPAVNQLRMRAQTNISGVYVWTFSIPFASGAVPVIGLAVEDGVAGVTWGHQITAISNTSVTIQLSKTTAVTVLGISVLGIAANPQAYVHLTAIAP